MNLFSILCTLLLVYMLVLLVTAVLSWFPLQYGSPVQRIKMNLDKVVDPLLRPIRNVLPPVEMGSMALDLAFLVLVFGLIILQRIVCSLA